MKKNLMLCALLLSVLLSGCAAEPLQGQTVGNTPKAPTPQEGTPASFEPVLCLSFYGALFTHQRKKNPNAYLRHHCLRESQTIAQVLFRYQQSPR